MSLVNDMLRDLDRRHYRPAGGHEAVLTGLGLAPRTAAQALPSRRGAVLAGTLLACACALAAHVYYEPTGTRTAPATEDIRLALAIPRAERTPAGPALTVSTAGPASNPSPSPAAGEPAVTTQQVETPPRHAEDTSPVLQATPSDVTATRVEVTPRPLSREAQQSRDLQAAGAAIAGGDHDGAERQLQDLLEQDDGLHQARLLLAGLYIRQHAAGRAEALLVTGLQHYPRHAAYARLYAQLLTAQARDSEAIDALETALPSAADDVAYHALLAGLYQRNGNSRAAVEGYRTALRIDPARGEWWAGLGIASEQAGDTQTAATAYRQAAQQPLDESVQRYVRQRLAHLAP